jgi:hypothetical protein
LTAACALSDMAKPTWPKRRKKWLKMLVFAHRLCKILLARAAEFFGVALEGD